MSASLSEVKSSQTNKRLNGRQIQHVRSLINVVRIVRRLQGFALGEWEQRRERSEDGVETFVEMPIEMNAHQVRAAGMLLDRCMPVLQSVQLEISNNPFEGQSMEDLRARLRHLMIADATDVQATASVSSLLELDDTDYSSLLA